ncbi:MAG: Phosphoesterase, PA-phosphatase related, partial [Thermomicrobiales bacterium]|nr:Phosphoesterase, PA-phosphatase related [Thermomicrobiales bacterium]
METPRTTHTTVLASPLTRRTALRGVGALGIATGLAIASHGHTSATEAATPAMPIEPDAGSWKTWVLSSGAELRPAAPPDDAASTTELAKLRMTAAYTYGRDAATPDRIAYWDAGSPGYRWNELAMQRTKAAAYGPGDAYRTMAYLNTAIYDATIAAWDAKYTYNRPRPAVAESALQTAIPTPASPSYPCEHAVTAGAASTVLAYLFPDEADSFAALALQAADSRLLAGVVYPSDTAAGLELGKAVAERFIERAKTDGWNAEFDPTTMPTGPGLWFGEPAAPMLGTWKPWVLESGDQFRPGPPPAPDSPERAAELEEIKTYPRDAHPYSELWFWPQDPAGRPTPDSVPFSSNQVVFYYAPVLHFLWGPELAQKLFEYRWDTNPPRAARAYALVSVASFDATVAVWDAKFHHWTARPNQFDSTLTTILPTYPIPDYPSGHAATLGGTAQVLSYL